MTKADTNKGFTGTGKPMCATRKSKGIFFILLRGVILSVLFLLFLSGLLGRAEDLMISSPPLLVKVFRIQYQNIDDVYLLICPQLSDRGSIFIKPSDKTIRVRDSEPVINRIENIIKNFDQPPETIVVRFQLVRGFEGEAEAAKPGPDKFGDGNRIAENSTITFPRGFENLTRWKRLEKLGEIEIRGSEGRKSNPVFFPGTPFRVEIVVGQVNKAEGLIELDRIILEKKTLDKKGDIAYEPVISTSEIVYANKLRIFGATQSEESRKALFLAMQGRIL